MKILLEKDVWEAGLERMNWIFDEFENVVVSFSGGKDSTVIFNLAMKVAKERGRLPLPVLFIDQEAEWNETIEQVRKVMYNPDVRPIWLQMPIKIENGTSFSARYLKCWDEEKPDGWLREKHLTENDWRHNDMLWQSFFRNDKIPVIASSPSFFQHVGEKSSLGHSWRVGGRTRQSQRFLGEDYDLLDFYAKNKEKAAP